MTPAIILGIAACVAVGLVAVWGMCRASLDFVERIEQRERREAALATPRVLSVHVTIKRHVC